MATYIGLAPKRGTPRRYITDIVLTADGVIRTKHNNETIRELDVRQHVPGWRYSGGHHGRERTDFRSDNLGVGVGLKITDVSGNVSIRVYDSINNFYCQNTDVESSQSIYNITPFPYHALNGVGLENETPDEIVGQHTLSDADYFALYTGAIVFAAYNFIDHHDANLHKYFTHGYVHDDAPLYTFLEDIEIKNSKNVDDWGRTWAGLAACVRWYVLNGLTEFLPGFDEPVDRYLFAKIMRAIAYEQTNIFVDEWHHNHPEDTWRTHFDAYQLYRTDAETYAPVDLMWTAPNLDWWRNVKTRWLSAALYQDYPEPATVALTKRTGTADTDIIVGDSMHATLSDSGATIITNNWEIKASDGTVAKRPVVAVRYYDVAAADVGKELRNVQTYQDAQGFNLAAASEWQTMNAAPPSE